MRLLISLLLNALALIITAKLVPGFSVANIQSAIFAAIILGVVNTFIKPIFVILTLPINLLTLGLFTFVINAVMLRITQLFVPGLNISSWLSAIIGAIVLAVVSTILSMLLKDVSK